MRAATRSPARPTWCGRCDERSRLLAIDGQNATRCPTCHPRTAQAAETRSRADSDAASLFGARLLRQAAERLPVLSANDLRASMDNARIDTGLRPGIFRAAVRSGLLERTGGHVVSTDPATKGQELKEYRSLILRCPVCRRPLSTDRIRAGAREHVVCEVT